VLSAECCDFVFASGTHDGRSEGWKQEKPHRSSSATVKERWDRSGPFLRGRVRTNPSRRFRGLAASACRRAGCEGVLEGASRISLMTVPPPPGTMDALRGEVA
jgi:hypothetical protein